MCLARVSVILPRQTAQRRFNSRGLRMLRFRSAFKHWANKGSPASFAFCAAIFTASWIIVIKKALIGLAAAAFLIGLAAAAAGDSRLS